MILSCRYVSSYVNRTHEIASFVGFSFLRDLSEWRPVVDQIYRAKSTKAERIASHRGRQGYTLGVRKRYAHIYIYIYIYIYTCSSGFYEARKRNKKTTGGLAGIFPPAIPRVSCTANRSANSVELELDPARSPRSCRSCQTRGRSPRNPPQGKGRRARRITSCRQESRPLRGNPLFSNEEKVLMGIETIALSRLSSLGSSPRDLYGFSRPRACFRSRRGSSQFRENVKVFAFGSTTRLENIRV